MANFLLCSICLLCDMYEIWVGGVDVYNVGCRMSVCACFVGTPVCVLYAGLNDNWKLYPRRDLSLCCLHIMFSTMYILA